MKFLAVPSLEKLSAILSCVDLGDRIISCKVEAYSCKPAGDDKKFSKALERQISEEYFPPHPPTLQGQHSSSTSASSISSSSSSASTSTSNSSSSASSSGVHHFSPVGSPAVPSPITPLGPIGESSTRKLLISLIQTMNAALSDYDFSQMRAEQFTREISPQTVRNSINNLFLTTFDHVTKNGIRDEFWKAINDCIDCEKCEIYSCSPDPDSDLGVNKLCAEAANKLSAKSGNSTTPAASPSPSKAAKHGMKRAMERTKNPAEHENRMEDASKHTDDNAMMESGAEHSHSKIVNISDSLLSSTDDDTENQDDHEDDTHSKRRRKQKYDDVDEDAAEESEDGGESVASSMTDGYIFDPDSDEQLAQIRQAAALQATEARVSGSPLNMPLRAPDSGAVFSLKLPPINTVDGDSKQPPFFPFTTSALSPFIAAVSFAQPAMPALNLQPPAKAVHTQLGTPQLQSYQRTASDDMNPASPNNSAMEPKPSFNVQGRSILSQRG